MLKKVCGEKKCSGCRACELICPYTAIHIEYTNEYQSAVIDSDKCVNCNLCKNICPSINQPEFLETIYCKQGWSKDGETRSKASSGGIATTISKEFIQKGGAVVGCIMQDGVTKLALAEKIENVDLFAGSKYVRSDTGSVFISVKKLLDKGKKVLFIGLPCQVAGLKGFLRNKTENLYTIDLICHGTPAQQLLDRFLEQYNINREEQSNIKFRNKNEFHIFIPRKKFVSEKVYDNYTRGFLKGLFYTENCYFCQYATEKRVSDITIGDAWGSELDESIVKAGVSLILINSNRGLELCESSSIHLENFDYQRAKIFNHQLEYPSPCPEKRKEFFKYINRGYSFNHAMLLCYPLEVGKGLLKEKMLWLIDREK